MFLEDFVLEIEKFRSKFELVIGRFGIYDYDYLLMLVFVFVILVEGISFILFIVEKN